VGWKWGDLPLIRVGLFGQSPWAAWFYSAAPAPNNVVTRDNSAWIYGALP